MIDHLLARAANPMQTQNERAAALSCAARLTGAPMPDWPDPPPGWEWQGGELVRTAPSSLPPLRWRRVDLWTGQEPPALPAPARPVAESKEPRPRVKGARRPPARQSGAGIVVELVMRPEGASLAELMQASGLSETSVKASISIYARGRVQHDRRIGRYLPVAAEAA